MPRWVRNALKAGVMSLREVQVLRGCHLLMEETDVPFPSPAGMGAPVVRAAQPVRDAGGEQAPAGRKRRQIAAPAF